METTPPEIWQRIFTLVAANYEDLFSCRLACRVFEEQSRPFLIPRFSITFRRRRDIQRLGYLATFPRLAETVRTLVFDARMYASEQSPQCERLEDEFRSIQNEYTWPAAVARALPNFKNIRVIEIATELKEQRSLGCKIVWLNSESEECVLDFLAIVAKTRLTRLDKIVGMTIGMPEHGVSLTALIDYDAKGLPDECAEFLYSRGQPLYAAMLSVAFHGLVDLGISLDIKEWEVNEIRKKQPVRSIWQACQSTLQTLKLSLVWTSNDDDPDSAASVVATASLGDHDGEDGEDGSDRDRHDEEDRNMRQARTEALRAVVGRFELPRLRGLTLTGWQLDEYGWQSIQSRFPCVHEARLVDGCRRNTLMKCSDGWKSFVENPSA